MTNKIPGANADLPCVRENFPNHKRRDLFQQKQRLHVGATHSGFLQSYLGLCMWGYFCKLLFSERSLVQAGETITAAHLNASPMLTLLWGHLLGKKDGSGGVE